MKKKALKIATILLLLVAGILVALPFFLEAKIGDLIKNNVNTNIDGTLDFREARLSLISSFPNAEVQLHEIYLLNESTFKGDTLFTAKEVELKMGLGELFKSADEPITIKRLFIDQAQLNIKVDAEENANYDIGKESEKSAEGEASDENFTFAMDSYEIRDSEINYSDLSSGIQLKLTTLNHTGSGDLSLEKSELQTNTTTLVSFAIDSTNYLNSNSIQLDALLAIDLEENKYSFLKNEALINKLPLVFDGFVKLNEDNQEVALSFKTPSSDFKNFLALIPEAYSKNIENVDTSGNFAVAGEINGLVDERHIPKFAITLQSSNASFKYPELPKTVTNINIDAEIKNTSGLSKDTYVDLKKASFSIDQDRFTINSRITDLMGNTKVNAHLDGKMNLANLSKAYPMPEDFDLKGMLSADVSTTFDMASIEKEQYENTKTEGTLDVSNFEYQSEELKHPVELKTVAMDFNPGTVYLKEMTGRTGNSDFGASGEIKNLLGFLFNDEKVRGDFNLESDTFVLNDFMSEETENPEASNDGGEEKVEGQESTESIKIPSFLDCTLKANANTVVYDNLRLKNVKGDLKIRDETATLSNMTSSLFDGQLAFNGEVSTKEKTPVFDMNLGMKDFRIGETFKALELFKVLAPIASALEGKLNSQIRLSGNLEEDFTPNLKTISGNVLAELLATDINPQKAQLLSSLTSQLNFINLKDLNLQGLKTALSFEGGTVKVKPFSIQYKDIAMQVEGGHTFDQKLNYNATLQVPAKYLGNEVNSLIAKIDENELENLTIPVKANIGGAYNQPEVRTDLTSGVKDLTTRLVDLQKQKLIDQGTDKAKDLLSGILASNESAPGDSVSTKDTTKADTKGVLSGILSNSSTKDADTSAKGKAKEEEAIKNTAKDVLGGLFKKKKKNEAKKDSVN